MFRSARILTFLILTALGSGTLFAQSCPPSDGKNIDSAQSSVLHGTIKFHPGTGSWIGLVLAKPACGASEIELAFSDGGYRAKQMDHCSVTVRGIIGESVTGHYSADLNIFNPEITPDPGCKLAPPDPDYTKMTIRDSIRSYTATVFTDIRGNKPLSGKASSAGHVLEPWQAYVESSLNSQKDLDLSCHQGFKLVAFKSAGSQSELLDTNIARLYANDDVPASLTIVCRKDK